MIFYHIITGKMRITRSSNMTCFARSDHVSTPRSRVAGISSDHGSDTRIFIRIDNNHALLIEHFYRTKHGVDCLNSV
jgi:hypothetical protein